MICTSGSLTSFFSKQQPAPVLASEPSNALNPIPNIGPLPVGLTPTQLVFKLHTGNDPHSLTIEKSAEWFNFMDLQADHKWQTFDIDWKAATSIFNNAYQHKNPPHFVPKDPRALHSALVDVEKIVITHLTSIISTKSSENTELWTRHCNAVAIVPYKKPADTKLQMSNRHKHVKYSGLQKDQSNHHVNYCDDGASLSIIVSTNPSLKSLIPYPQHKGIFDGKKINHHILTQHLTSTLELAYRILVLENSEIVSVENSNFSLFLVDRVQDVDGSPMLNIDGLEVGQNVAVVTKAGIPYNKLDVLKIQEKQD